MEFIDVIKARKSCRQFSSRKIFKKRVLEILDAARLAPSAENRQPWFFVILENEIKNEVADILDKDLKRKDLLEINKPTIEDVAVASLPNSIRIIREAPILILIFRSDNNIWRDADLLSIGCSIENMHLAATNLGLASIILRDVVYKKSKITKILDIKDAELITAFAVGYGIEIRKQTPKKEIDEIMKWIK